jgi:hypothetical protein
MVASGGRYGDAFDLAMAIRIFLHRTGRERISSAAIFEMTVKVLRRVRMNRAAEAMEEHRAHRTERRMRMKLLGEDGTPVAWDKGLLAAMVERSWSVARGTARIIAGRAERKVLSGRSGLVSRQALVDLLNEMVAQYGLADAVPVHPPMS